MDIKVLGSGSSGNCYHISDGRSSLLLDAGLRFKQIQQGIDFKVSELSGVLVTHEHMDHAKAVKDMMKAGIDCYMSEGTAVGAGISQYTEIVPGKTIIVTHYSIHYKLHLVEAMKAFTVGSFLVIPFATKHDSNEPLGFFLQSTVTGERLLYATDTCYLPNRFSGMTHIMIEVNHCRETLDANVAAGVVDPSLRNRIVSNHMALQTAIEFFKANDLGKVQRIVLLHLSDSNAQAEKILQEVQKATGKVVEIA